MNGTLAPPGRQMSLRVFGPVGSDTFPVVEIDPERTRAILRTRLGFAIAVWSDSRWTLRVGEVPNLPRAHAAVAWPQR